MLQQWAFTKAVKNSSRATRNVSVLFVSHPVFCGSSFGRSWHWGSYRVATEECWWISWVGSEHPTLGVSNITELLQKFREANSFEGFLCDQCGSYSNNAAGCKAAMSDLDKVGMQCEFVDPHRSWQFGNTAFVEKHGQLYLDYFGRSLACSSQNSPWY